MEIDLVAAALQLYLYAACGSLTFQNQTAAEVRDEIKTSLRAASSFFSAEEVKRLINVFLNTSADKVIRTIQTKTLFPPANVVLVFRQLEALRPNLLKTARRHGFDPRVGEAHNINYFALEFLEQRYVRHLLSELCDTVTLSSVILVHDGLYLSPQVSEADIAAASAKAATLTSMPVLHFAYHHLDSIWDRTFGHIARKVAQQRASAKRLRLSDNSGSADTLETEPTPFLRSNKALTFDSGSGKLVKRKAHITQFAEQAHSHKKRRMAYEARSTNSSSNTAVFETVASKTTLFAYFAKKRIFGMD